MTTGMIHHQQAADNVPQTKYFPLYKAPSSKELINIIYDLSVLIMKCGSSGTPSDLHRYRQRHVSSSSRCTHPLNERNYTRHSCLSKIV